MQDLNTIITNNFKENVFYLENKQPELFSKISALDNVVVNGHYQEKYEWVCENNGFDEVEKSSLHANIASGAINFKKHINSLLHKNSPEAIQHYIDLLKRD